MLTIRLSRKGKKNQPFFNVVVMDKRRSAKGGRAVEILGYVDPLTKRKSLKKERVQYWLSKGAKPSDTMHNLFVQEKIIDAKKIHVARVKKAEAAAPAQAVPAASPATPAVNAEPEKAEPAGEAPSNDGAAKENPPAEEPKPEEPKSVS